MPKTTEGRNKGFLFRRLSRDVLIGSDSDRYAGWIGQIYTPGRYERGITRRSHKVKDGASGGIVREARVKSIFASSPDNSVLPPIFLYAKLHLREPKGAMIWRKDMNVQKLFEALANDMDNSALGIICSELESQGYSVQLNDTPVSSEKIFEGAFREIEEDTKPLMVSIIKGGHIEQKFLIEFTDFHEITLRKA